MATPLGRETDVLGFFASLANAPYRHDFYQTMRRLECLFADKPRWGQALRPVDEPVRLGQDPDLSFAPASLARFDTSPGGGPPRLQVRVFGLLGPNGPMPLHITEYARDRLRHAGDPTLSRFLDLFNHRFIALLYRAWAQAQPNVSRDRPGDDRFAAFVGAFIGIAPATLRNRDTVPDTAKLFHAGKLVRQARSVEGLVSIVRQFFGVGARVEEYVGHWLLLGTGERTYLGRPGASLGAGAVVGATRLGPAAQVPCAPRAIVVLGVRELSSRWRQAPATGGLGPPVSLLRAGVGCPVALEEAGSPPAAAGTWRTPGVDDVARAPTRR